jgi:hypothetical protein
MAPGKLVLAAAGVAVVVLMTLGLFFTNFYSSLGHTEQVRGLVTFLFVLVTVSIILVFALGIFWLDNPDDMLKRFAAAKDLLTIVVGIVGTIMGFYFGSATGESSSFSIANAALVPQVAEAGQAVSLSGHINGGSKPYKYTVIFADPANTLTAAQLGAMKLNEGSADGTISKDIKLPPVEKPAVLLYTLTASDAKNVSAISNGALYIEAKKPAGGAATPPVAATPSK